MGDHVASRSGARRGLGAAMAGVAVLVAGFAAVAVAAPAGYGAQTLADEPQYLLSAGSLFHQASLDIADDLRAERWRPYHGVDLPEQTAPRPDGQRLSPHDPLLPIVLAVPVGLGGWVAAKATLAVLAGALAALLVWIAVIRLQVPVAIAAAVTAAFGVVPPLSAYATQVYPELPAALSVTVAVAALTGPLGRRARWLAVGALVALPWLSVKYAPVTAALALVLVVTLWRRGERSAARRTVAVLAAAGAAYLLIHQAVYGGWTVYAVGDHFRGAELSVMGSQPDYPARAIRLVGLLVDHDFGLVAWAPAYLLAVPALAALARRRPPATAVLVVPLAAGWLNAAFVALTMHGWWWPGRQVVVVLPLVVLAVAWWAGTVVAWAKVWPWLVAATAIGVVAWTWLLAEVFLGGARLIVDFAQRAGPVSAAWRLLLPDDRILAPLDRVRLTVWILALGGLAAWSWRHAGPPAQPAARSLRSIPSDHRPLPERSFS